MLVAAFVIAGVGAVLYNITAISLMQTLTPERLLGRLNATRRFIVWGTIPLGSLVGGALASQIGLHATLWVGAIGATRLLPAGRALADPPHPRDADRARGRSRRAHRDASAGRSPMPELPEMEAWRPASWTSRCALTRSSGPARRTSRR